MLTTQIRSNSYQDSINLMLATNAVNAVEGVTRSSIMMGSDANKDIFRSSGLLTEEAEAAKPADMMIVIDAEDDGAVEQALAELDRFLSDLSTKRASKERANARNLAEALEYLPDANLALFSIPGEYAAPDMETALRAGLSVFSFTDNVSKADELMLKELAHESGLLMMGPDCGTGIISGVPLAFTNAVRPGNIGIVGASGTGIQEVTCIIDRLGGGVLHAIGTGGRDLSAEIGGITMKDALVALENDDAVDVIGLISKPPAKEVRDEIVALLHSLTKPVVAVFLGENPEHHEQNVFLAHTLEETARILVDLANGDEVQSRYDLKVEHTVDGTLPESATVKGLYSGGTLAGEAAMLMSEAMDLGGLIKKEGYQLDSNGYQVIDLGDDMYTQGRPHPMIDPGIRLEFIKRYAADEDTHVILLDCVLGYGTHPEMAAELAKAIREAREIAASTGKELTFIASVCGTHSDPQNYDAAVSTLADAGALVESTNARAVRLALQLKGYDIVELAKDVVTVDRPTVELPEPGEKVMELLTSKPKVVNIGLESFNDSIATFGGESVQVDWKPIAGGNKQLIRILSDLKRMPEIADANERVIGRLRDSQPFLVDVVPAKTVIDVLNSHTLLHAGPPINYENMTSPMQGSCVGAILFEGWASGATEARRMLEAGEISFEPCHHHHAVGPMGGITSGNMPVLVVKNMVDDTVAYCTMNEGIGKVLRFGAFSQEVVDRLIWMRDVLGPTLSKALQSIEGGINLNVLIARSIAMGDEFHQRNIAGSLNFFKEIMPVIEVLEIDAAEKQAVVRFLADTDQFFLNIMMAAGKAMVDYARQIEQGTVVTTLTRNGENFGVRIAGMGDEWFTAPVNTPNGLYFTGYSEEDANPDIGDSAITETVGVGAMATVAAPAVTRFVGSGGGYDDALALTEEMDRICISNNPNWSIPNWNFKGASLGIDACKVVETGITPVINTGIAHREAGVGQIGAGTVAAPLACFEQALIAYAQKLGFDVS